MPEDAVSDSESVRIEHQPNERLFRLTVGGLDAAHLDYQDVPGGWDLVRTVTEPQFRGHGHAGALVRFVLDAAREHDLQVVPTCCYVAWWISRHAEYAGLVAAP